jgi:FKBP-type peptidyl-prolyl cis-trans isomerase FkpA
MRANNIFTTAIRRVLVAAVVLGPMLGLQARADDSAATTGTTVTLPSGVQYVDLVLGTGEQATTDSTVQLHYVGRLTDGTVFERSRERILPQPVTVRVGSADVVGGLNDGVQGMRVGGRRLIIVPPQHGYGNVGRRPLIPPDATLIFDAELVNIKKTEPPPSPPSL